LADSSRSLATSWIRRPIQVRIPRSRSPSMSSMACSRLDVRSPSAFRNIKPAGKSCAPHPPHAPRSLGDELAAFEIPILPRSCCCSLSCLATVCTHPSWPHKDATESLPAPQHIPHLVIERLIARRPSDRRWCLLPRPVTEASRDYQALDRGLKIRSAGYSLRRPATEVHGIARTLIAVGKFDRSRARFQVR
jgi:hypothetical protein